MKHFCSVTKQQCLDQNNNVSFQRSSVLLFEFNFVVRQNMHLISNSLHEIRHFCFDANPYPTGRRGLRRNRNVCASSIFRVVAHTNLNSPSKTRVFWRPTTQKTGFLPRFPRPASRQDPAASQMASRQPSRFSCHWRSRNAASQCPAPPEFFLRTRHRRAATLPVA